MSRLAEGDVKLSSYYNFILSVIEFVEIWACAIYIRVYVICSENMNEDLPQNNTSHLN